MNKMLALLVTVALVLTLSACGQMNDGVREQNNGNVDTYNLQGKRYNSNNNLFGMDRTDRGVPYDNSYTGNSDRNNGNGGQHDNRNMEVSDEVAEQIADMAEVQSANVLLTNRNAYIAVIMDDDNNKGKNTNPMAKGQIMGEDISPHLKMQISKKVKQLKPNVRNVYISANPDFTDRVSGYMEEIEQGRPVSGFMEEFNTMVRRLFPDTR